VVAESLLDRADWGLRLICEEEAKEPVTAIAEVGSYLITAEGQKVRFSCRARRIAKGFD